MRQISAELFSLESADLALDAKMKWEREWLLNIMVKTFMSHHLSCMSVA